MVPEGELLVDEEEVPLVPEPDPDELEVEPLVWVVELDPVPLLVPLVLLEEPLEVELVPDPLVPDVLEVWLEPEELLPVLVEPEG